MNASTNYWVHDLDPFLIHFGGDFGLRYYGLAYVLGFLIAFWLLGKFRRSGLSPLTKTQESDVILFLAIGALVGGRIGFMLLYDFSSFIHEPWTIFEVWRGGMASHGGFAGVVLAGWWITNRYRIHLTRLIDLIAVMTPPGLMLGRIANFVNGELWGRISYVSWAVIFPESATPGTPISQIAPRHPSQLYEAALEGLLCTIYTQLRAWKSNVVREYPGQLGGEFLALYGIVRMIGELFREPDASLIFNLSRGSFYSIFMIIAGAGIILYARRKHAV